jgi:hypothetical protein
LSKALKSDKWPSDTSIIWPEKTQEIHPITPPAWSLLQEAIDWCMAAAHNLPFSTLLLNFCNKKQENQAAIFIKSSVDAAQNAFTMFVNRTPLSVN